MASLRYSAAEESEDTLNSFTSHTKQPSVVSRFPGHSALQKIVERRCDGTPSSHSSDHRTGVDSPDSAVSLGAPQSQFIDEDIEFLVLTQRQPGFRRSWCEEVGVVKRVHLLSGEVRRVATALKVVEEVQDIEDE